MCQRINLHIAVPSLIFSDEYDILDCFRKGIFLQYEPFFRQTCLYVESLKKGSSEKDFFFLKRLYLVSHNWGFYYDDQKGKMPLWHNGPERR
jgi:hypothetical protein